jgi:S1-C subfamily serine protease
MYISSFSTGTHVPHTYAFATSVSALINRSNNDGAPVPGTLGSPLVTAQGRLVGLQNGRQFVSISSILVAASKTLATDLSLTFVPAQELDLKLMRLVDAGLSVACMRATGFIIFAGGREYGTGFLCKWKGKRFVITNYHVLGLLKDAQEAWLEFRALSPVLRVKLDPSKLHLADKALDFAVIAISESSLRDLKFVEPLELSSEESIEAVVLQVLGYPSGCLLLKFVSPCVLVAFY